MSKHIHLHIHDSAFSYNGTYDPKDLLEEKSRLRDAVRHDPSTGQFTSGGEEYKYHGREGRRTKQGYKILHIIEVGGKTHEIQASTKEKALEIAKGRVEKKTNDKCNCK